MNAGFLEELKISCIELIGGSMQELLERLHTAREVLKQLMVRL